LKAAAKAKQLQCLKQRANAAKMQREAAAKAKKNQKDAQARRGSTLLHQMPHSDEKHFGDPIHAY